METKSCQAAFRVAPAEHILVLLLAHVAGDSAQITFNTHAALHATRLKLGNMPTLQTQPAMQWQPFLQDALRK